MHCVAYACVQCNVWCGTQGVGILSGQICFTPCRIFGSGTETAGMFG